MVEHRCVLGVAWLAIFLTGCGSTITTRIQSEPYRPVPKGVLSSAEIVRDARRDRLSVGKGKPETSPGELKQWAGTDSRRLAQAAEIVLRLAESSAVSKRGLRGGYALAACELAYRSLLQSGVPSSRWDATPATRRSVAIYNTALAAFVFEHSRALAAGSGTLTVETPLGTRSVAPRYATEDRYHSRYFDRLVPADYVKVTGFKKRARTDGIGAPLVGIRERTEARRPELAFQPPKRGVFAPLGSFADFDRESNGQTQVRLKVYDLDRTATARIQGKSLLLAGDFTAPVAMSFEGINDLMLGVRAILNVEAGADYNGIYLIEPFDPDRIPVLLLHGLTSSPLVWRNVATDAMKNPLIRANFQFWYAFYSTGVPVPQSAALIRDKIALIRGSGDPGGNSRASKNIVIVGYSMGGTIARILATDVGEQLWTLVSKTPFDQVQLEPEDREELRRLIFWKPVPGVREVIFLATPHRGTRMADASFAQLGRKFVGLPTSLVRFQTRVLSSLVDVLDGLKVSRRSFTGIDSLSPEAPIYKAFEHAPFAPGFAYHSVIGDRGRGDSRHSSVGSVGYSSSHLDGAESELIVPTGHDVQTHQKTETEIQRILLSYLPRG